MTMPVSLGYADHRFLADIINHAVWLSFCFPLSLRMIEEMLAARGIVINHETVRQWALKLGLPQVLGYPRHAGILAPVFDPGERVAWILRLVQIGAEGEGRARDVMEINRPDDLGDITDLGMRLDETKRLLARLQQEIVTAQVSEHAARRHTCERW